MKFEARLESLKCYFHQRILLIACTQFYLVILQEIGALKWTLDTLQPWLFSNGCMVAYLQCLGKNPEVKLLTICRMTMHSIVRISFNNHGGTTSSWKLDVFK